MRGDRRGPGMGIWQSLESHVTRLAESTQVSICFILSSPWTWHTSTVMGALRVFSCTSELCEGFVWLWCDTVNMCDDVLPWMDCYVKYSCPYWRAITSVDLLCWSIDQSHRRDHVWNAIHGVGMHMGWCRSVVCRWSVFAGRVARRSENNARFASTT